MMNKTMLKSYLKKMISPSIRLKIKKILGKENVDEGEIIYQLIKSKDKSKVMIDVGAHYGGSLERYARDGWQIYAFEPDPSNREQLIQLCGQLKNVKIDSRAVSDKNKKDCQYYKSDISTGISGLSSFHPSHKEAFLVNTITLDSFCMENNILNIDFLKIDTEGFDLFVLRGLPWDKVQPELILCEFEDKKTKSLGYDFHDMSNYLIDKGYQLMISEWYPIVEYGKAHDWRRFTSYPCELMDKNAWGNIIAVKEEEDFNKICSLAEKYEKRFN